VQKLIAAIKLTGWSGVQVAKIQYGGWQGRCKYRSVIADSDSDMISWIPVRLVSAYGLTDHLRVAAVFQNGRHEYETSGK